MWAEITGGRAENVKLGHKGEKVIDEILQGRNTDMPLPPEVVAAQELSSKPKPKDTTGPTIFGEDLITEKSLDEVILGYLSGDGEDGG